MEEVPTSFQKWVQECVKEKFETTIERELLDKKKNLQDIAQKIIQSKEMVSLIASIKPVYDEHVSSSRANFIVTSESRPQTSMSIASDLSGDEWGPMPPVRTDHLTHIANKISHDKPVHVRLAGYEALARSELSNFSSSQSWDLLLKALRDGITDESQPIFEASLQAHTIILNGSQVQQDIFTNLLNAFSTLYNSKRLHNMLPTFVSGINFKVSLHEKLFRIMYLIIRHQEEILKSNRNTEKVLEEIVEKFVAFLSSHSLGNTNQMQTLTALNIVSVLEPKSDWFKKWAHSLTTLKILTAALARSPALLKNVIYFTRAGIPESQSTLTAYIADEPPEVNISGDTVRVATHLHCLCFLTQLCSRAIGRELLEQFKSDKPFDIPDFMFSLLNSLNVIAVSDIPTSIYDISRSALQKLLDSPSVLYDARLQKIVLDPLLKPQDQRKIYPHMIDVMVQLLNTEEGSHFMISRFGESSVKYEERSTVVCPADVILEYTSELLWQPLSIMNVEHVVDLFKFIERLFEFYDVCNAVKYILKDKFYPAIAQLYNKMDKYSTENEVKKQILNSAIKTMLLKIVSMPFALQLLIKEDIVFEELLRGLVEPLKSSWSGADFVAFVSTAALFPLGFEILRDLAPNFLSKLLRDICTKLENPKSFYDPWEDCATKEFLHILRLLSLNNSSFIAVWDFTNQENSTSEDSYPNNLYELLQHSINSDSPYHCLALMALNVFVHNLDTNIYLNHKLNFQAILLNLQENCFVQTEVDGEPKIMYSIDEGSLLRHKVLLNSYFVTNKLIENTEKPEQTTLFSKLPPPVKLDIPKLDPKMSSTSELKKFLQETKPGLRDNGWVLQVRKAHKISIKEPIEHSVLVDLLDQMQRAVPVFELTSHFKWPIVDDNDSDMLLPEEVLGTKIALLYAEQNQLMQVTPITKAHLGIFLKKVHGFIQYGQPKKFQEFDWFVATIFIICNGNMERCKKFVTQIVQFPSVMYIWSTLGKSINDNNKLPENIPITFAHLLEGIVANELPTVKYALKNNCGVNWWMICNEIISHCFWGTLPWCEIVHLIAICIMYPPDYILYYCTSLLHFCRNQLMDDVTAGKMWPEHMELTNYRCRDHFQLMDLFSKRYQNTILPLLVEQKTELPA